MTEPKKTKRRHYRDGLLRVSGKSADTMETALLCGIAQGAEMHQEWLTEMDVVQMVLDWEDCPPKLRKIAEDYKAALEHLDSVTLNIVADHQLALHQTMRGPV